MLRCFRKHKLKDPKGKEEERGTNQHCGFLEIWKTLYVINISETTFVDFYWDIPENGKLFSAYT
jgi:hypothetical protein